MEVGDASDLGPVVATKRPAKVDNILMIIFSAALATPAVLAFGSEPLIALAFIGVCTGLAALGVLHLTTRYEIRTRGITMRSAVSARSIAFSSVRAIRYSLVVQRYIKSVGLELIPITGRPFRFGAVIRLRAADDPDLATLREQLSRSLALKMQDDLRREAAVVWIEHGWAGMLKHPTLKITRDGFTIDDGRSTLDVYATDVTLRIEDGDFSLIRRGDRKKLFMCPVATVNFFPGLMLLSRLRPESVPGAARRGNAAPSSSARRTSHRTEAD